MCFPNLITPKIIQNEVQALPPSVDKYKAVTLPVLSVMSTCNPILSVSNVEHDVLFGKRLTVTPLSIVINTLLLYRCGLTIRVVVQ